MGSRSLFVLPALLLALVGCGSSDQGEDTEPAAAAQSTEMGTGTDTEQKAGQFPGYPVLVELSSLDSRVASEMKGHTAEGKVVASAPGLYTPYNTQFRDLNRYYKNPTIYGDDMMKQEHFPMSPGTTWGGVQPGTQEPKG